MADKVHLGVIGTGAMGQGHLTHLPDMEEADLTCICDIDEETRKTISEKYNVRGLANYKELIDCGLAEAVLIATPHYFHSPVGIYAMRAGLHVLVEKPIGVTIGAADELAAAARETGRVFSAMFQFRFTPQFRKALEIVESGEIGDRRAVIAYSGGSALWGYTHAADMLLFLASDAEIEYVQGNVSVADADFEDNRTESDPSIVMGYVRFKNGTHGISIPGSAYEFEVDCSNGAVRSLNNGDGFQLRKRQGQWNEILDAEFPDFEVKSGTVGCIEDIVEAIDTDRETKGNIRLARISTELTLGIVDSQRQKGARVYMPMENRSLYLGRW